VSSGGLTTQPIYTVIMTFIGLYLLEARGFKWLTANEVQKADDDEGDVYCYDHRHMQRVSACYTGMWLGDATRETSSL